MEMATARGWFSLPRMRKTTAAMDRVTVPDRGGVYRKGVPRLPRLGLGQVSCRQPWNDWQAVRRQRNVTFMASAEYGNSSAADCCVAS